MQLNVTSIVLDIIILAMKSLELTIYGIILIFLFIEDLDLVYIRMKIFFDKNNNPLINTSCKGHLSPWPFDDLDML